MGLNESQEDKESGRLIDYQRVRNSGAAQKVAEICFVVRTIL